jgi:hypothetical protein
LLGLLVADTGVLAAVIGYIVKAGAGAIRAGLVV